MALFFGRIRFKGLDGFVFGFVFRSQVGSKGLDGFVFPPKWLCF